MLTLDPVDLSGPERRFCYLRRLRHLRQQGFAQQIRLAVCAAWAECSHDVAGVIDPRDHLNVVIQRAYEELEST